MLIETHYLIINVLIVIYKMFQKVSSCLKPGGKLYVAIENKLGLKYFAGCSEDHLGRPLKQCPLFLYPSARWLFLVAEKVGIILAICYRSQLLPYNHLSISLFRELYFLHHRPHYRHHCHQNSLIKNMTDQGLKQISIMGTMHEVGYHEGAIDENTQCNPRSMYVIFIFSCRKRKCLLPFLNRYCKLCKNRIIFQIISINIIGALILGQ